MNVLNHKKYPRYLYLKKILIFNLWQGPIVVDLDLFVSGSVFRDGTKYPPKSMCGLGDVSHHPYTNQARRVSTFYLLVLALALGSKVNIPYDYDSPVAALSAELVQAL